MKIGILICAILATGLCLGGVLAVDKNSKFEAHARVSKAKAEKIALAKVPGDEIKDIEVDLLPGPAKSSTTRLTTKKSSAKTTRTRKMMMNRDPVDLEHGLSPRCRRAFTG